MAVTVEFGGDGVDVRFTGRHRVWALSRGLHIPFERIESVQSVHRRDAVRASSKLRLPGTDLPRLLRAGSYGRGARRQLWCVGSAEDVLAIDLCGRPYSRVVVEVTDPGATAALVRAGAGRSR